MDLQQVSQGRHAIWGGAVILAIALFFSGWATSDASPAPSDAPKQLAVLWTSGDPEVAHRVALMYTHGAASQDWFDDVRLIVWGPSARLLAADKDIQTYVARLQESGVEVQACVVCADSYGVADQIRALDIEVKAMGQPLTDYLQDDDWEVLAF